MDRGEKESDEEKVLSSVPFVSVTGNYPDIVTGARFQTTDFYTIFKNVQTGLMLTKYYSYSTECLGGVARLLDDLYLGYTNYTGNTNLWPDMMLFTGKTIAQDFAPFNYYCFLFKTSFDTYTTKSYNSFNGFTDLYTSALFNLLSVSLTIKTLTTNIKN